MAEIEQADIAVLHSEAEVAERVEALVEPVEAPVQVRPGRPAARPDRADGISQANLLALGDRDPLEVRIDRGEAVAVVE